MHFPISHCANSTLSVITSVWIVRITTYKMYTVPLPIISCYMYIASTMNPMNDNESDSLYDDGCDIHKLTNACDYIQLLHFLNNY